MSSRPRKREGASVHVWAVPVLANVICLWIVAPAAYTQVDVRPHATAKLIVRRRLIASGRRVHIFVYDAPEFRASVACAVSFRPEATAAVVTVESAVRLADWNSPSIGSVMRTLVDALGSARPDGVAAILLGRFFSLTSAWRVSCSFAGTVGAFSAAVFDMTWASGDRIGLFVAEGPVVRIEPAYAVQLDATRCCLLWHGNLFERAYLDAGRELLELGVDRIDDPRARSFDAWFTELPPDDRGRILEAWIALSPDKSLGDVSDFNDFFPAASETGSESWFADCVVETAGALYVFLVGAAADRDLTPQATVEIPGGRARRLTLRHQLTSSSDGSTDKQLLIYRSETDDEGAIRGPVRLTTTVRGRTSVKWLRLSSIEDAGTRRQLRAIVPWHLADGDLIRDLAIPMAVASGRGESLRPPEIEIHPGAVATTRDDVLFVCRHDGDLATLQLTLVGISLTTPGVSPRLRLVVRGEPTSDDIQALHALSREHEVATTVVAVPGDESISTAFAFRPEDRHCRGVVYLASGAVPRDAGWWEGLAAALARDPASVFWAPPVGREPPASLSVRDLAAGSLPVIALGRDVSSSIAEPHAELLTFAGFVAHAVAAGERRGVLKTHRGLHFHALGGEGEKRVAFADARLDDAVIAWLLDEPERTVRLISSSESDRRLGSRQSSDQLSAGG